MLIEWLDFSVLEDLLSQTSFARDEPLVHNGVFSQAVYLVRGHEIPTLVAVAPQGVLMLLVLCQMCLPNTVLDVTSLQDMTQ